MLSLQEKALGGFQCKAEIRERERIIYYSKLSPLPSTPQMQKQFTLLLPLVLSYLWPRRVSPHPSPAQPNPVILTYSIKESIQKLLAVCPPHPHSSNQLTPKPTQRNLLPLLLSLAGLYLPVLLAASCLQTHSSSPSFLPPHQRPTLFKI